MSDQTVAEWREVLLALGQALFVATGYYEDPTAKIAVMVPPSDELRQQRLAELHKAYQWFYSASSKF